MPRDYAALTDRWSESPAALTERKSLIDGGNSGREISLHGPPPDRRIRRRAGEQIGASSKQSDPIITPLIPAAQSICGRLSLTGSAP